MVIDLSLSVKDDHFETPFNIFYDLQDLTGLKFDLDFCASQFNKKCNLFIDEKTNALEIELKKQYTIFCNPPRSKNKKFVDKLYNIWINHNCDIVVLLCWNDLGNQYAQKILNGILSKKIKVYNLGKPKFLKNGIESKYNSRLSYFAAWLKKV